MWINFTVVLILCLITFIGFSSYSLAKNTQDKVPTRVELANQLAELPYDINNDGIPPGAMCYSQRPPDELQLEEYVCPVCGERTFHHVNNMALDEKGNINYLESYRNKAKQITKIDVKLDETQFCKNCSPNTKNPQYCVIVTYDKNSKPHKTCDIDMDDLNLLYDFSEGKKEHTVYYALLALEKEKCPIEKYKTRLEELLGTKLK